MPGVAGMAEARTLSVSVPVPWPSLYDAIREPAFFPRWASGLSRGGLVPEGGRWRAEGPEGPVWIRFTPPNPFGVMDHWVEPGSGAEVYVPMRVVPNGEGAEVLLTLFRQPGMSDEGVQADAAWMARDLAALRALFVPDERRT